MSKGRRTFGVDSGDALGGSDVPYPNGLVSRRRHEQIRVGGMPAELIHAVAVASVVVLFNLDTEARLSSHSQHQYSC